MAKTLTPDERSNAETLRLRGRFADASRFVRRRLRGDDVGNISDPEAGLRLGMSLMFEGRLSEALAYFGDVYVATRDRPDCHGLAVRALRYHINVLQRLQDADPPERIEANVRQQMQLIEEGLQWLRAIGRAAWTSGFLYHKALGHLARDEPEKALDVAEASLRSARGRRDQSTYCRVDHFVLVARCARRTGHLTRTQEALDTSRSHFEGVMDELRVSLERARLLRAFPRPRLAESLEAARRAVQATREVQAPRDVLFAHEERAFCAVAAGSFAEARTAAEAVYQRAAENDTEDRRFLLRRAIGSFQQVRDRLTADSDPGAETLRTQIERKQDELAVLLDECDPA